MSELQKFLKGKSFEQIKEELSKKPYSCIIQEDSDFPEYFLLKYNQIDSDFYNPIVRECRGCILKKSDYSFVCRPFDKFGNYGEGYVPDIDLNTAYASEKIDGSLIKVWHSNEYERWMVSTNGMIDAFKSELQNDLSPFKTFGEMFVHVFSFPKLHTELYTDLTYMFEIVSPWNRIVVQYPKLEVYFLAARDNVDGHYEYCSSMREFKHPKLYSINSLDQVVRMAKDLPFNNEGYVVADGNNNRVKIKSPAYVAVHHLKNNGVITKKRLLDIILLGEDVEFLTYFPEYEKEMGDMQDAFSIFMSRVHKDVDEYLCKYSLLNPRDKEQRKEFAIWAVKTTYPPLMFSFLDGKIKTEDWRLFIKQIDSEKLVKIIEGVKE